MGVGDSKQEVTLTQTLTTLYRKLDDTRKQSQKAQAQIQSLRTNIAETLVKLEECEATVKVTQGNIVQEQASHDASKTTLLEAHKSLTQSVKDQMQTLAALEKTKSETDSKISTLKSEITKYQSGFKGYEDQIAGYVISKKLVLVEISKVEKQLGELRAQLQAATASGSQQIQTLNAQKSQLETQLSQLNSQLASQNTDTTSIMQKIALLETENQKLKTHYAEISAKLQASTSVNITVGAEIARLTKEKDNLTAEIQSLEKLISLNTISEQDKSKAQVMLEEQKKMLEKELGDLTSLNTSISNQLKSLASTSAQNQKDFQERLATQKSTNQQIISNLQSRFEQTSQKISSVQAQINNFSILEKQLRERIQELTKRAAGLSAEKTNIETGIQSVSQEVTKTNVVINDLKQQVQQLTQKLKQYNEGVFKHVPGMKLTGNDVMSPWQGSDIHTCFKMCAENRQCKAFTRQGTSCTFKDSNASDGVDWRTQGQNDIDTYIRHSVDEEVVVKQLQLMQQRVDKCNADLAQIMESFHSDRPVPLNYDGVNICSLKGVVVKGWFVHSDGLCYQVCPDQKQERHGNGRCKCEDTNQNQYCPKHTTCVKTSNQPGMCMGNKFGVPPPKPPALSELAMPGSARCPDYWYIIKNDDQFRQKHNFPNNSFDHFWGRCAPHSEKNVPTNSECNKITTFVNDNWFQTRSAWAKKCGVKWSAFEQ